MFILTDVKIIYLYAWELSSMDEIPANARFITKHLNCSSKTTRIFDQNVRAVSLDSKLLSRLTSDEGWPATAKPEFGMQSESQMVETQ